MPDKVADDCFAHTDRLLRHGEAIALLRERVRPIAGVEPVPLQAALGRVVGQSIRAPRPVPADANSAVDGFAFRFAEYDPKSGATLRLAGRAAAGHPLRESVPADSAVRILTGGVVPDGFDTVAMQEDCAVQSDAAGGRASVAIPPGLRRGGNVRHAGEDVAAGQVILDTGDFIRPQDVAAIASLGLGEVSCFQRLRVAIVSTGDELTPPGSRNAGSGAVYDVNAPMLAALTGLAGCEAHELGIWPDEPHEVRTRLAAAARDFDVVLTSGGASRGEEDHMAAAVATLGSRHFWQIAVKPGRPLMFGQIGNATIVGLPGNPVAGFVCFLLYVWPLVRRLAGAPWTEPRRLRVRAGFDFANRKRGRREFWRGTLIDTPDGLAVDKFKRDGSGLISGLRAADGLIDIAEDTGAVNRGDQVDFIPFTEFGIVSR